MINLRNQIYILKQNEIHILWTIELNQSNMNKETWKINKQNRGICVDTNSLRFNKLTISLKYYWYPAGHSLPPVVYIQPLINLWANNVNTSLSKKTEFLVNLYCKFWKNLPQRLLIRNSDNGQNHWKSVNFPPLQMFFYGQII